MYRRFTKATILTVFALLLVTGATNFVVDPGKIYLNKILAERSSTKLADAILNSKNGIIQTGWNERLVKTSLAKKAYRADCVIIGSSHIMQISTIRNGSIKDKCKNIINLGVSGGSLEDIAVFSYLILNNIFYPDTIFISIEPWVLKYGMDARWAANTKLYQDMLATLKVSDSGENPSYLNKVIQNLLNGEYLYYSLNMLLNGEKVMFFNSKGFEKEIRTPDNKYSYSGGYIEAVTLQDGSHVYASPHIAKTKKENPSIEIGGGGYKISDPISDPNAFNFLDQIISHLIKQGIDVNLILTPYHPNVFRAGETKPVRHMTEVERLMRHYAKSKKIAIYGSYFSNKVGCKASEFFDYMHPTTECLDRISYKD